MRLFSFSLRTVKEIVRDPLNVIFGLGFPVVVLLLLTAIQANVPVALFEIESLTPGITVFGLSFLALFSATLVAKDRETAFLQRLYVTPMRGWEFVLGYVLPLLPVALAQSAICYLVGICLGLTPSVTIVYALLVSLPVALFFIGVGVLFGSALSVKGASGVCGGLLTNLTAWLSGVWFDLSLVGKGFQSFAKLLPFAHAVEMERAALSGSFAGIAFLWVCGYALAVLVGATLLFLRQMKK